MFTTRLFSSPANIDVYRTVSRKLVNDRILQSHGFASQGRYQDLPDTLTDHVSMPVLDEHMPEAFYDSEEWALSTAGEETFARLVDASIAYFQTHGHMVAPAHDLRHMLVKDMAEALRFAEEGPVTGYKRFFLIASLWHDMGRLLEAHFDEAGIEPGAKVPHAILSFGLLRDFLDKEGGDLPEPLREQLLYAVQAHSGRNGNCFIARAVQRADRFQLLGAEGFLRAIAYDGGVCGYPLTLNREQTQINTVDLESLRAVPNIVDFLGRNLYDNITFDNGDRERILRAQSQALVRLMLPDDDRDYLDCSSIASAINHPTKTEVNEAYYDILTRLNEARDMSTPDLIELLSVPGNAPLDTDVMVRLNASYEALDIESQELLNMSLKACAPLQAEGDKQDYDFLSGLAAQKGSQSPEGKLAQLAIQMGELNRHAAPQNDVGDKKESRPASPQTGPA